MALPDDGRFPALAADPRPGRDVRGHGDGNESARAPLRPVLPAVAQAEPGQPGHQVWLGMEL